MNEVIYFQLSGADGFGDDVLSDKYKTRCDAEHSSAFSRGLNAELETEELTVWIEPDSLIYQDKGLDMAGLLARYPTIDGPRWRVERVVPGSSLVTNEPDLVELTLTRITTDEQ